MLNVNTADENMQKSNDSKSMGDNYTVGVTPGCSNMQEV